MYKLGLTGSIATGKSTILAMFADFGVPTYSADAAVHALYENEAVEPVGAVFPDMVKAGRIDRQALSHYLVANPHRLPALEAIVHPLVRTKMAQFLQETEAKGADLAVLEIPLLFETGISYPVDGIAVADCSQQVQMQRALARDGMTEQKLQTLLERQMPLAQKRQRADFVIHTDINIEATRAEVAAIIKSCRTKDQEIQP